MKIEVMSFRCIQLLGFDWICGHRNASECSSCFTYILKTTDSARCEINEISGGAGDIQLLHAVAGVNAVDAEFCVLQINFRGNMFFMYRLMTVRKVILNINS